MYRVFTLLFFIIFLFSDGYAQIVRGHLDLKNLNLNKRIPLVGQWEFYPNQLLMPQDFDGVEPLPNVKYVKVPALKPTWQDGSMPDTGFGTYRLIIYPPYEDLYAIEIQLIYSAAKIFANNKLVAEIGKVGTSKKNSKDVYCFDFYPIPYNGTDKYLQLIIQVSDFSAAKKFGITQVLYFGTYEALAYENTLEGALLFFAFGILFLIAIYHFAIFLFFKKRAEVLYLGLLAVVMLIRAVFTNVIFLPPVDFTLAHKTSFITALLIPWLLTMIYKNVFDNFLSKKLLSLISYITWIGVAILIVIPVYYFDYFGFAVSLFYFSVVILLLIKLFYQLKKSYSKISLWAISAHIILFITSINDFLFYLRLVNTAYITHFSLAVIAIFLTLLIAQFFSDIFRQNMKLKNDLEKQYLILEKLVNKRTQELVKINNQLKELSIIAQETTNLIAVFDEKLFIIWVNKSFEKTFGVYAENIKGRKKITDFDNYSDFNSIIENYLKKGNSVRYQTQVNTSEGLKWLQVTLTPIIENGNLQKIISIQTDITEIKNTQDQLQLKNNEIEASIYYAKRIQTAFLTPFEEILNHFDAFKILKPKAIVSGDFYWFKDISTSEKRQYLVALVDCTGHGVPGAFMSLIASRLLDDLVEHHKIYNPSEILKILNKKIIEALRQNENKNTDGFDIVLTKIEENSDNQDKLILTFASASMPFFIYHKQRNSVIRYKGDVYHIGGVFANQLISFNNSEIEIDKNDIIYFISDGMTTMINKQKEKFGVSRLMVYLRTWGKLPLEEQKKELEEVIDQWLENTTLRDDITIFAFRWK